MIIWAIWCIQKHYRVPLSYDLTTFQILGQKLSNFFVGILVETMTPKGHFEINWPLVSAKFSFFDQIPNLSGVVVMAIKYIDWNPT